LIKEEPPPEPTINHDLLFKKLLEIYFEPFLQAFYPELHKKLDFTHQKLLSEEFIAGAKTSQKHIADLVIGTKHKNTKEKSSYTSNPKAIVSLTSTSECTFTTVYSTQNTNNPLSHTQTLSNKTSSI